MDLDQIRKDIGESIKSLQPCWKTDGLCRSDYGNIGNSRAYLCSIKEGREVLEKVGSLVTDIIFDIQAQFQDMMKRSRLPRGGEGD